MPHSYSISISAMTQDAVSMMQRKEYRSAIEVLSRAVKLYKVVSSERQQQQQQDSQKGEEGTCDVAPIDLDDFIAYDFLSEAKRKSCEESLHHGGGGRTNDPDFSDRLLPPNQQPCSSIYNKPILVSEWLLQPGDDDDRLHPIISLVLLFNLALAHHLYATEEKTTDGRVISSEERTSLLLKAARLDMLVQLMQELDQTESRCGNVLFTMMVVNNSACVYESLGMVDYAKKFFDRLLSITLYLVDYGKRWGGNEESQQPQLGRAMVRMNGSSLPSSVESRPSMLLASSSLAVDFILGSSKHIYGMVDAVAPAA